MDNEQYSLIEQQGVNYFGAMAGRLGYLFRKVSVFDKTIDGEIELTQGVERDGQTIAVKIVPESRFEKSAEGFISIQVTEQILSSWKNYKHPVIMATYSMSDNQEIYWTRVDCALSTTIKINLDNKFDDKTSKEFLRIIFSYYTNLGLGLKTAPFSEVLMEFGQSGRDALGPLQETYDEAEEMMNKKDYSAAKTVYQSLSIIYKKVPVFRLNHAISMYYSGDYMDCIKLCKDLMQDYNHNPKLHSLMGNSFAKMGDYETAQKHLDNSIKLLPLSGEVWNSLGLLYFWQGRDKEAHDAFKVALKHDQFNEAINFNMALCNSMLGKNNEAMDYYEKCIKINSENYDAYNNKAILLKSVWRLGEAIDCFEKAIETNPDNCHAVFNLACLLKDMGYNDRAIKYYNRCIELGKNVEKVYYDLACVYCRLNELEKASYYFDKVYNYAKYDVTREIFDGTVEIIDTEYEALYLVKIQYTPETTKVIEVTHDKKLTFFNMNSFMKECIKALNDKNSTSCHNDDKYNDNVYIKNLMDK